MARRSRAREVALQLLFQRDQNATPMPRPAVQAFARERLTDKGLIAFCLQLTDGVEAHREAIDKLLSSTAENWRLSRMMPCDRNVLRLGAFELLHAAPPEPVPVVIDEAVELARRFGTLDSPGFVNGILDRVARSRKSEGGSGKETAEMPPPPSSQLTGVSKERNQTPLPLPPAVEATSPSRGEVGSPSTLFTSPLEGEVGAERSDETGGGSHTEQESPPP